MSEKGEVTIAVEDQALGAAPSAVDGPAKAKLEAIELAFLAKNRDPSKSIFTHIVDDLSEKSNVKFMCNSVLAVILQENFSAVM